MSKIDLLQLGGGLANAQSPDDWYPGKKKWLNSQPPIEASEDLTRVLALPRRLPLDPESDKAKALIEMMTERWTRGERECDCKNIDPKIAKGTRRCIKSFKFVQAWTLYEAGIVGGLYGSIPTGTGKTLIDILVPLALAPLGIRRSLLLIPPTLLKQLERDYRLIREHFQVPGLRIHGLEKEYVVPDAPILHVLPYSRLSLHTSSTWIRNLQPEAIISDESDRLSNVDGAAASRVERYLLEYPHTKFLCWTGSPTNASIVDYGQLIAWALKSQSPLPLDKMTLSEWARAIDACDSPAPPGELKHLCDGLDIDGTTTTGVREGYRRRLAETMGVIIWGEPSVKAELVISERKVDLIPPIIQKALELTRTLHVRPDTLLGEKYDEELLEDALVAKCARELASGIFYRNRFDPIDGVPQKRVDVDEWREARKEYHCELRETLKPRDEWLDSPKLCEDAAKRFYGDIAPDPERPVWQSATWNRWKAIKDKVKPTQEGCRVSDYLVMDAARWAAEHKGIVWYGMVEFGQWIAEVSNLPLHDGGPKADERIMKEVGKTSIIASLNSHGRGRDGLQQLYSKQLIAQIPSSARTTEQLLGRLHRDGQLSNVVYAWFYAHTAELKKAVDKLLRRAQYVKGTLADQKILKLGE